MRVAIVGGTGHISGSIVKFLLEMGHEISCFHRSHTDDLLDSVEQILGDRNDRDTFEAAAQTGNFDAAIDMISFNADDAASSLRAFAGVKHFIHC